MSKKIYVGNLSFNTTDEQLGQLFLPYGHVSSSRVIADKFTGRSRGFGFVEMDSNEEADKAIAELNGKNVEGRDLNVNEAKPRENGSRGNGAFGGGFRGGRERF
jgi:RNA recognition motif-containing protein